MVDSNPEGVKRYAPPVQRNRLLNRRKSGDKFEKANFSGIDGEKRHASSVRNMPAVDHREAGSSNVPNENTRSRLIPVEGCCTSEAAQILTERWAAAMRLYNDPAVDSSEKPIMYSAASGSSWGLLKLPHQMDFLAELQRAVHAHPTAGSSTWDRD